VKKGTWLIVTVLALALGAAGYHVVGFIIAALIIGVPYLVICYLAPRARHTGWGGCNGTGEARSRLFPWSYHRCQGCNGTGRQIRMGARLVGQEHVKAEYAAGQAARKQRASQRAWR